MKLHIFFSKAYLREEIYLDRTVTKTTNKSELKPLETELDKITQFSQKMIYEPEGAYQRLRPGGLGG